MISLLVDERKKIIASTIFNEIIHENPTGFTLDIRTMSLVTPGIDRYVVSLEEHEGKYPIPVTAWNTYEWLIKKYEILLMDGFHLGGWPYEGFFYFDINVIIQGEDNAIKFGLDQKQIAIYYPFEERKINLDKYRKEVAA